jgi:hypothetical protein
MNKESLASKKAMTTKLNSKTIFVGGESLPTFSATTKNEIPKKKENNFLKYYIYGQNPLDVFGRG